MILHIVLYEPKPSRSAADLAGFKATLLRASTTIDSLRQVRVGRTVDLGMDYKDRSQGQLFGYVAIFEFESVAGLKDYMAHATHVELADQFWKHCDRTMILDVEAEDPRA